MSSMQCDTEFEHQLDICSGTEEDCSKRLRVCRPQDIPVAWTLLDCFLWCTVQHFNFCQTQRSAFMSIRPLSGRDSTAREISEPFYMRSRSREKRFVISIRLSVRPSVPMYEGKSESKVPYFSATK